MNEIPNPASVAAPSTEALILARRLAIQILHEAQIAQPAAIHGWVYERGGQPSVFRLAAADMGTHRADENLWARLWSNPTTPAVPSPAELRENLINLIVSLNTKGVLELRAWELQNQQVVEREIRIAD